MDFLYDDRDPLKYFLRDADLLSYLRTFRDILKITKISQLKYITKDDLVSIGFTSSEKRRYQKAYDKYFPNPYFANLKGFIRKKKRKLWRRRSFPPVELEQFTEASIKVPTKHIIAMEDISINVQLGVGQFGVVQQGTWTTGNQRVQVAIKCLGQGMTSNSTEFLKEAAVMHAIEHPNIVRLYGVVLHMDTLMLVTELASLRSLLECLRDTGLRLNFPVLTLCEFAEQICDGMAYLENKRLIHRDLAARNILVFNKNKVKISDFGLSRALGAGKDYYQTNYNVNLKLPVAWCAPECILYLRFTSASDVWAFGVCLWEMFTYGFQPWAAFSGQQILEAIDTPNCQRLERPDCCPESYYSMMRDCWSHDPHKRPKFKELRLKLRAIRPEEVITILQIRAPEGSRRASFLDCKEGQVITVLGKESMTKTAMWYGVISGGTCGMFDPKHTKPYKSTDKCSSVESLSPEPERRSSLSIPNLQRSDTKRHTYTGKRTIQSDMISCPQGDMKHTGHIGLDGAHFGDISFLDPAACMSRNVMYRPPVDSEQVPLINPNSPSHLKSSSDTQMPYPPQLNQQHRADYYEIENPPSQTQSWSLKKPPQKKVSESTKSKNILKRVKSATLGRSHKTENHKTTPKTDDVHEYQEIVDPETERNTSENNKREKSIPPESPTSPKETSDFSDNLLEEMESILRNMELRRKDEHVSDVDGCHRHNGLNKKNPLGTMKQMSAQEEKTLNTAVALANEITSKSMNDLDGPSKPAASPNDKHKLNFKFGQLYLNNHTTHEHEKDTAGKQERRNFSEEAKAKSKDLQSTITKESKAAYTCLIEEPTPSTSRMVQVAKNANRAYKTATMPKPLSDTNSNNILRPATMPRPAVLPRPESVIMSDVKRNIHLNTGARPKEKLSQQIPVKNQMSVDEVDKGEQNVAVNVLPLPPRSTNTVLIDMPRHIRKYPLKIPNAVDVVDQKPAPRNSNKGKPIIYQNTYRNLESHLPVTENRNNERLNSNLICLHNARFDNSVGQRVAKSYDDDDDDDDNNVSGLVKDYVSVEDLLEFADLKPCGRQRGVESDEVRIMMKVFNENVSPEQCLEALDFCDWDVHHAIKLLSIKMSVGDYVDLEDCYSELLKARGDITKAVNLLNLQKRC